MGPTNYASCKLLFLILQRLYDLTLAHRWLTNYCVMSYVNVITRPKPSWDGLGWGGLQSDGKAAKKCSPYLERAVARQLEVSVGKAVKLTTSLSWLRECNSGYLGNITCFLQWSIHKLSCYINSELRVDLCGGWKHLLCRE